MKETERLGSSVAQGQSSLSARESIVQSQLDAAPHFETDLLATAEWAPGRGPAIVYMVIGHGWHWK